MAIGDNTNPNLFGTNYNPEDEERKKAELAARNARMGAGSPTGTGAATPSSTFGQIPASNPFSVQVFEDPSFTVRTGDAIVQTPEDQSELEYRGRERYNLSKNLEKNSLMKALDDYRIENPVGPLNIPKIDEAQQRIFGEMYTDDVLSGQAFDEDRPFTVAENLENLTDRMKRANDYIIRNRAGVLESNSPQANFLARQEKGGSLTLKEREDANALAASMGTTFSSRTGYSREPFNVAKNAELNPQMTEMRPVNPQTGEFLSQDVIAAGENAGLTFPSQVSLPKPQAPIAPMGEEETRAALGGMTLNEYLNAPTGTPGVSGLQTDPQGRMVPNIGQFQAQPEVAQPPVGSAVTNAVTQPPASALSSFEQDSLARQQRIGGTGSFEGDSAAREARLKANERQPGESQTERDTRVAQSRTQGSRAGGQLSQSDLRDLAQGSSRDATDGEKARALEIQQRAGLGEFKPDMTTSEQEALRVESADKDSFNTSISSSTSPQGVVDYNQALNEYVKGGGSSKGYLEFLRKGQELEQKAKDAGKKPEITVVEIDGFRALLQDGRYMTGTTVGGEELSTSAIRTLQGRIELLGDAEEDYLSGDPERMKRAERTITALDIKKDFGGQLSAKDYFEPNSDDNSQVTASGLTQQQEENIQKVIAANPGSKRAEVIEAMRKEGKL